MLTEPPKRVHDRAEGIVSQCEVSLIHEQVEMGVAIRMAVLEALTRGLARDRRNAP